MAKNLASAMSADDERKHELVLISCDGIPSVLCTLCGSHASQRVDNLRFTCLRKPPSSAVRARVNRVFKFGLHPDPKQDRRVEWVSRLREGQLLAAAAAGDEEAW